jgi:spore coat protein H
MTAAVFAVLAAVAAAPLPYESVFDDSKVHTIHLTIAPDDFAKMDEGERFSYVKADAEIDGTKVAGVGVRRKGDSAREIGSVKTSYKIRFGKFIKKRRFRGLERLVLDAAPEDPTMIREKLAYDLFRDAGCPSSRAAHAMLYLTVPGRMEKSYVGLYTMVEYVGETFLDERFGGHTGNLYKIHGWVDIFSPRAAGAESMKTVRLETNKKKNDRTHLGAFLRSVGSGRGDLETWLDRDRFLRCLAVNTLLVNLDSYAATGQNFYLYDDPKTKRFIYIPWDLDQAFGQLQFGVKEAMLDWDVFDPEVDDRVLIRRALSLEADRKRYGEILGGLIDGPFSTRTMSERIDRLHALLRPAAELDRNKRFSIEDFDRTMTVDLPITGKNPFHRVSIGLKAFIEGRDKSVRDQLTGKRRGAKLSREDMLRDRPTTSVGPR